MIIPKTPLTGLLKGKDWKTLTFLEGKSKDRLRRKNLFRKGQRIMEDLFFYQSGEIDLRKKKLNFEQTIYRDNKY